MTDDKAGHVQSELSAGGMKRDVKNTPKCTCTNCILAQQSSLGPPPGFGPNDDVADDGGDDDDNDSGNDDDDDNKSKHSARDWAGTTAGRGFLPLGTEIENRSISSMMMKMKIRMRVIRSRMTMMISEMFFAYFCYHKLS